MQSVMKVSVILTVLNEGPGMDELLEALLAQSTPPDEIVIVDGGSRDDTLARLQAWAARDARVKVHVAPGVNISRGRNIAIGLASGDVLAVTDGGCRPDVHWLAGLLQPLRDDPTVGAVGGRFVPVSANRFEFYAGLMSVPDLGSESQRGMFYGRSSAFRRVVWERVGGYPEWLYTGEDTLFAIAAGKLGGHRVVYAPESLLSWRPRPTLRKLTKMFYLYGRGNGRIANGDLRGSLYWLRYHALLAVALLLSPWQPWLLLLVGAAAWQLGRTLVAPNLALLRHAPGVAADRYLHVPLIAMARNLATNLGYLRGWDELRRGADFKQRLEAYLAGPQR